MSVPAASIPASGVAELELGAAPADPWAELDVDVTTPGGAVLRVPAFVRDGVWRFRYSSEEEGRHAFRAGGIAGGIEGGIHVEPRGTGIALRDRGPIRVAADRRRFEHADGTPFLWVGDTWWHGFVTGKIDDDEFRDLARMRAEQGFSVVQLVVLPPEAGAFDASVRSRTGWPWREAFAELNLAWWDDADRRIEILVDEGLVPCIVGSWGYHLGWMDDRQALRHWREMVARWGALPVTWCLAGEPPLTWYEESRVIWEQITAEGVAPRDRLFRFRDLIREPGRAQLDRLHVIARELRTLDPFRRITTTHIIPGEQSWEFLDEETIDYRMLQTGHAGYGDLAKAVAMVEEALRHSPRMPVVNGEPAYEGIGGTNWEDIQRVQFWTHMLLGAAGHTYGAHGVWGMNTEEFPGQYSGAAAYWRDAKSFSGARSVGSGADLLRTLEWWTLTPRPDLVHPSYTPATPYAPYAAELGDGTRIVYLPATGYFSDRVVLRDLGDGPWTATFLELGLNRAFPAFSLDPGPDGTAELPLGTFERPSGGDMLLVARRADAPL